MELYMECSSRIFDWTWFIICGFLHLHFLTLDPCTATLMLLCLILICFSLWRSVLTPSPFQKAYLDILPHSPSLNETFLWSYLLINLQRPLTIAKADSDYIYWTNRNSPILWNLVDRTLRIFSNYHNRHTLWCLSIVPLGVYTIEF